MAFAVTWSAVKAESAPVNKGGITPPPGGDDGQSCRLLFGLVCAAILSVKGSFLNLGYPLLVLSAWD